MSEDKCNHEVIARNYILNWTEIYSLLSSIPIERQKKGIFRMLNSNNLEKTACMNNIYGVNKIILKIGEYK